MYTTQKTLNTPCNCWQNLSANSVWPCGILDTNSRTTRRLWIRNFNTLW